MFNSKICIPLGGLLLVAALSIVAANPAKCNGCIANSMVKMTDEYEQKRQCWMNKYQHILAKEKLFCLEAVVTTVQQAIKVNNDLAEDNCKTDVQLTPCDTDKDYDAKSKCVLDSLRTLTKAYRDQEQCHGSTFKTDEMKLAHRIMKAYIVGWTGIHPDC